MFLRKSLSGFLGIIFACAIVVVAQEPQPQTPANPDGTFRRERIERRQRHRERLGRRGFRIGRLMRELNLTEEQRQQGRAIMQRRLESTKAQREELFKLREKRIAGTFTAEDEARTRALRQEIRTAMDGVRTEMAGVLTAEQKAKLEQLKKERKERMEQRMKERQERLNQNIQ
jgi:Spy/CpxP family protein refolding chaperone